MVAIDGGRERSHVRKIESEVGGFKDEDREEERDKVWKIRRGLAGSILIGHLWVRSDSLFLILS